MCVSMYKDIMDYTRFMYNNKNSHGNKSRILVRRLAVNKNEHCACTPTTTSRAQAKPAPRARRAQ